MRTSHDRILTTHVGSLPRATELFVRLRANENAGDAISKELAQMVRLSVEQVVQKQVDLGIDIVNDGEHSKSSFSSCVER